jgi:hypothetical protein
MIAVLCIYCQRFMRVACRNGKLAGRCMDKGGTESQRKKAVTPVYALAVPHLSSLWSPQGGKIGYT